MATDNGHNLVHNDQIVEMLSQAIYRGAAALKYVPELVKDLILEKRWEKRIIRRTGETQVFTSFEEFVITSPLEGLGSDVVTLRNLCANSPDVLRLIDDLISKDSLPDNNYRPYIMRRLEREKPALARKVANGYVSVRGAAKEIGFQERRTRLFPADIKDTAEKIIKVFETEWRDDSKTALAQLIHLLAEHLDNPL